MEFIFLVVVEFFFQRLRGGILFSEIEGWNFVFRDGGVEFCFQRLRGGILFSEIEGWKFVFRD